MSRSGVCNKDGFNERTCSVKLVREGVMNSTIFVAACALCYFYVYVYVSMRQIFLATTTIILFAAEVSIMTAQQLEALPDR